MPANPLYRTEERVGSERGRELWFSVAYFDLQAACVGGPFWCGTEGLSALVLCRPSWAHCWRGHTGRAQPREWDRRVSSGWDTHPTNALYNCSCAHPRGDNSVGSTPDISISFTRPLASSLSRQRRCPGLNEHGASRPESLRLRRLRSLERPAYSSMSVTAPRTNDKTNQREIPLE